MKFLFALLKFFSSAILKKYHPDIIGITGSVGKTSTKEAIKNVLEGTIAVRATKKNYNNQIGVPLTVIGIDTPPNRSIVGWLATFAKALGLLIVRDKKYPTVLVLEMGADRPGDIAYLTKLAPCRVGVFTSVAHAHTEFFGSLQKIAEEKRIIISHLPKTGTAILNFDNPLVMEQARVTRAPVVTYGYKEGADWRASDVNFAVDEATGWPVGLRFKVSHAGSIVPIVLRGIVAEPFVYSALAALAVADAYGINKITAGERLSSSHFIPGHLALIPGIKHTLIIDDTYNSSPDAAKVALRLLGQIHVDDKHKRIAVLGDMLELGHDSENLHREIGFAVAEHGIDWLVTVGAASKHTSMGAREAGMDEGYIVSFDTSPEAGKYLQEKITQGDVLLIKGSQGIRCEKIVKELMAEPLNAAKLLVRQTPEWMKK